MPVKEMPNASPTTSRLIRAMMCHFQRVQIVAVIKVNNYKDRRARQVTTVASDLCKSQQCSISEQNIYTALLHNNCNICNNNNNNNNNKDNND